MNVKETDEFRMIKQTNDPEREIQKKMNHPFEASGADCVKLTLGNIRERVKLQQEGKMNVPRPIDEYIDTLVNEYEQEITKGNDVYQFFFYDFKYYDTFEDSKNPSSPDYKEVEEVPDAWPTVREVSMEKDIDKSVVNTEIYNGNLKAVMCRGERRIKPTETYKNWSPSRKKSYLRDRRLFLVNEVLSYENVSTVEEMYEKVKEKEIKRFGGEQIDTTIASFLDDMIEDTPDTLQGWQEVIQALSHEHDLNKIDKAKRAFQEGTNEEDISLIKQGLNL